MDYAQGFPIEDLYTSQSNVARGSGCNPGDVLRMARKFGYTPVVVAGRPMFYTSDAEKLIEQIKAHKAGRTA